MKKFLSLVLALVMTMSLVTISAGAKDFTDDDKITYEEAVNVISEIGVVDGYADGKFNPTNTLTRQAAAKIICNLILGPTTAAELHADTAPYKDVPATSEFAGYIAYCAKEGIISGYADGTFKPGNTLTGYAFMKMLLGALGYDQEIEGYVGGNWSINVAKQAINIGLNKSLEGEFNGIKAVTREEACLYAFNTLKSDLVEYDTTISTTINGQTVTIGNSQAKAMQWKNSATRKNNIKADNYIQFAEQYFPKLVLEDTTDAFGRPAREWSFKGEEIGTYINRDLLVEVYTEEVTGKDLYELLGKNVVADYDFDIYVDGETEKAVLADAYFTSGNLLKTNDKAVGETGNGVLTEVYVDTDAKEVTIAIINTYLAKATKDYDEKKEVAEFNIWGIKDAGKKQYVKAVGEDDVDLTASIDDFDVEDIEEKDIVLVTIAEGEIQTIAEPEVLSDTAITAFKKGSNLTAGGTKYSYADTACYDGDALVIYTSEDGVTINLKDTTYNVFLDAYGYVIGVEEIDPDDNYVFITGYDDKYSNLSTKTADVAAIFIDGTMDVIKVDVKKSDAELFDGSMKRAWTGEKSVNDEAIMNVWCTYTVNDDGVYTLKVADKQSVMDVGSSTVTIDKKHISLDGKTGKIYGNDASVYLNVTLDKIATDSTHYAQIIDDVDSVSTGIKSTSLSVKETVTGSASVNVPVGEIYALYNSSNWVIAAVVIGEDNGSSTSYAYVTSDDVELEAYDASTKDHTWTREVVINGKLTTISYVDDTIDEIDATSMKQGHWYEVKYFADGTVKSTTEVTGTAANNDKFIDKVENIEPTSDTYTGDTTYLLNETAVTKLTYKNGSLYTNTDMTKGFAVSPSATIVLCNADGKANPFDTVDDTYEGYNGLKDAIEDANANFQGTVSAILESGVATTVIINCTAKDPGYDGGKETGSTDYVAYLVVGDTGEYNGKVSLVVETKDGKNVTEAVDYKYTLTSSSLISDKQTSVEGSGVIAAGANVGYVAFAAPNTMLSYQATVVIGNDTIVTDVLFG